MLIKLKFKLKSSTKDIPFNISRPWGDSIAMYLGTTLNELKTNLPNDPTLLPAVQSTCALVRDQSIKILANKNKIAITAFKDICYGGGYLMQHKKLTMTGGCNSEYLPKEGAINLGDGANEIVGTCTNSESPFVLKRSSDATSNKQNSDDLISRMQVKEHLGGGPSNLPIVQKAVYGQPTGNNEPEPADGDDQSWLQFGFKSGVRQSSNDNIPKQVNSTLAGKGNTLNHAPKSRKVKNVDKTLFSEEQGSSTKEDMTWYQWLFQTFFSSQEEEENAIGGGGDAKDALKESDEKEITELKIPEWFCPVVCAGLNLEDLFDDKEIDEHKKVPMPAKESNSPFDPMADEELKLLNKGRYGVDPEYKREMNVMMEEEVSSLKDMYGNQKCAGILPSAMDCLENGDIIAEWFMERLLNSKIMCNQDKNSCESVYN